MNVQVESIDSPPGAIVELHQQKSAESYWFLDFVAWTVALAVIGYPLAGLASAYFAVPDDTISIAFRLLVIFLSASIFVVNGMRYGLRPIDTSLTIFIVLYLLRLIWDTGRADQPGADL